MPGSRHLETRRRALGGAAARVALAVALTNPGARAFAQASDPAGTASADARPEDAAADAAFAAAVREWTGGAALREGRVRLSIDPIVENGNAVPVEIAVDDGEGAGRVVALALFNTRNPQPRVVEARFGPRSGSPWLATRIRLATSQRVLAIARTADGTCWSQAADVVVTLAACIE